MKFFNLFKKKAPQSISSKIVNITRILTENNNTAIATIEMLINFPDKFETKYSDWLDMIGFSVKDEPDLITAYWLTGYDTPYNFGSFFVWKEDPFEIVQSLEESIKNKNYSLNLADIRFYDNDFTDEALVKINTYLNKKKFVLTCWNTDSDSYHLYIVKKGDFQKLVDLGKAININFYSF